MDRVLAACHLECPRRDRICASQRPQEADRSPSRRGGNRPGWRAGGPEVAMTRVAEQMPVIVLYCPLASGHQHRCANPRGNREDTHGPGKVPGCPVRRPAPPPPTPRRPMPLCSCCHRRCSSGCDSASQPWRVRVAPTLAAHLEQQSPQPLWHRGPALL